MAIIDKMKIKGNLYDIADREARDTLPSKINYQWSPTLSGKVLMIAADGKVFAGSGGGGGGTWGTIVGDIVDQTDLMDEFGKKLNTTYSTSDAGKALIVGADGKAVPTDLATQSQADWDETVTTKVSYIKNKPDVQVKGNLVTAFQTTPDNNHYPSELLTYNSLNTKQDTLVSGANIKTINSQSVLGSGDISITSSTDWGDIGGTLANQTDLQAALNSKSPTSYGAGNENKYLKTDATGTVTLVDIPATQWGGIEGTLTNQTDLNNKLTELSADIGTKVSTAQGTSEAGKFLKVNASGNLEPSTLPNAEWSKIGGDITTQTDLQTALNGKINKLQLSSDAGKALIIGSTGEVSPETIEVPFGKVTGEVSSNTNLANALGEKINTNAINDSETGTDKLWSSSKINNLISALAGVVTVTVVETLPTTPVNNTMYYVGTTNPYHVYLRANDITYDMGTTEIDLSSYVQKTDIVDNLESTATDKPLSANQGKVINESFLGLKGGTMNGDINMGERAITNLAAPTNATDAATKGYIDSYQSYYLPKAGGTMTGDINMGTKKVSNLATPTANTDAANKSYVDTKAGNYLPLIGGTVTGAITLRSDQTNFYTSSADGAVQSCIRTYKDGMMQIGRKATNGAEWWDGPGLMLFKEGGFTLSGSNNTGSTKYTLACWGDGNLRWCDKFVQATSEWYVSVSSVHSSVSNLDFYYTWLNDHAILLSFIFAMGSITVTEVRTPIIGISISGGKSIRQGPIPITSFELSSSPKVVRCEILDNYVTLDCAKTTNVPAGYYQITGVMYVY